MAVKNKKGIVSQNRKRMYEGKEVKPVMYSVRGKKKMVGSVDGELILNKLGQPIPFKQL